MDRDAAQVADLLRELQRDLQDRIGRRIVQTALSVGRAASLPRMAGEPGLAYLLTLRLGEERRDGCLLLPAGFAFRLGAAVLVSEGTTEGPSPAAVRGAVVALAPAVAAAVERAARGSAATARVGSGGCAAVAVGTRPPLSYEEGVELLVGRVRWRLQDGPEAEWLAIVPPLVPRR